MKLKNYRYSLLTLLASLFGASVFFFVKTIMLIPSINNVSDTIIFILSFLVLFAFIGLEFTNTIVSMKKGSTFVKPLAYDRDGSLNKRGLVIFSLMGIASLAAAIYSLFVVLDYPLYFAILAKPIQYLALSLFTLVFINMFYIDLYVILKLDN